MKRNGYLKSAATLSLGGILAKGIGALYRVALGAVLGGYGMGLYQMAYPLFCVLVTFSSSGIPSALARIVAREEAEGGESRETLRAALPLFALLGLIGWGGMLLLSPLMSALQGERALSGCYFALAPSVFLVALIAVLRGYFQGKNDMFPTAASQIAEQLVKAAFGLLLARRFSDPFRAVSAALFAVTLSEGAALCLLLFRVRAEGRPRFLRARRRSGGEILRAALPVMAATALLPLSQTADSVLLVRLFPSGGEGAIARYGLFSGGALPLVSLPATLCYGLAAASVPAVSRAFAGGEEDGRRRALYALGATLLLSVPCALGLFLFARPIVSLLYGGLEAGERETLVSLLRLLSVSAATLAGTDTLAACLTGMGRAKRAALAMLVAVLVKFALELLLAPVYGAAGAAIAANGCYLVAFFLDLVYTVRKPKEKQYDHDRKSRNGARRPHPEGDGGAARGGRGPRSHGTYAGGCRT